MSRNPLEPMEEALTPIAVIRTTLETLQVFPDDRELCEELERVIADARVGLFNAIAEAAALCPEGPAPELRDPLHHLLTCGVPRRVLDHLMKVDLFVRVGAAAANSDTAVYRYPLPSGTTPDQLESLPTLALWRRLLQDLEHAASENGSYTDSVTFDREVFQRYVALLYAAYASADPIFYGCGGAL